jgi:hypothetical protein
MKLFRAIGGHGLGSREQGFSVWAAELSQLLIDLIGHFFGKGRIMQFFVKALAFVHGPF